MGENAALCDAGNAPAKVSASLSSATGARRLQIRGEGGVPQCAVTAALPRQPCSCFFAPAMPYGVLAQSRRLTPASLFFFIFSACCREATTNIRREVGGAGQVL